MKKVLSLALALVMMFAVCIPAFAIDLNAGSNMGKTDVIVDGIRDMGEGTYTVTIPAEVEINWGDQLTDIDYSIFCQLQTGKKVTVSVSSADAYTMTNNANTAILKYSLSDTTYTTTKSVVLESAPEKAKAKVIIAEDDWNNASIDNYRGTLTFTAGLTN